MKRKAMATFIKENKEEIDKHILHQVKNIQKINNEERRLWILNDENLYSWARSEGVNV
jgi:hypothetical protein